MKIAEVDREIGTRLGNATFILDAGCELLQVPERFEELMGKLKELGLLERCVRI